MKNRVMVMVWMMMMKWILMKEEGRRYITTDQGSLDNLGGLIIIKSDCILVNYNYFINQ